MDAILAALQEIDFEAIIAKVMEVLQQILAALGVDTPETL